MDGEPQCLARFFRRLMLKQFEFWAFAVGLANQHNI
jgi:hypothetical protein